MDSKSNPIQQSITYTYEDEKHNVNIIGDYKIGVVYEIDIKDCIVEFHGFSTKQTIYFCLPYLLYNSKDLSGIMIDYEEGKSPKIYQAGAKNATTMEAFPNEFKNRGDAKIFYMPSEDRQIDDGSYIKKLYLPLRETTSTYIKSDLNYNITTSSV